jgi:hypothetical protein
LCHYIVYREIFIYQIVIFIFRSANAGTYACRLSNCRDPKKTKITDHTLVSVIPNPMPIHSGLNPPSRDDVIYLYNQIGKTFWVFEHMCSFSYVMTFIRGLFFFFTQFQYYQIISLSNLFLFNGMLILFNFGTIYCYHSFFWETSLVSYKLL